MITDDFKNGSIIFFFPGVFRILIALAYWTLLLLLLFFNSFFFLLFFILNIFTDLFLAIAFQIRVTCIVTFEALIFIHIYVRACVCDVCVMCVCVSYCRVTLANGDRKKKKRKAKIKKTWNISYLVVDWIWFGSVRYIILLLKLCVVTLLLES